MFLIIAAGGLFAGYQFYSFRSDRLPAMTTEGQKIDGEIKNHQAELRRLHSFAQNIETIKHELKDLNLQLETALDYLPRNFNLSSLLRTTTRLAQNSGVELLSFRPKKGPETRKQNDFYASITVDFELKGTFSQTVVFLDQLSRLKRIVNVDSLKIKPNEVSSSGLAMALTQGIIRTYRFVE